MTHLPTDMPPFSTWPLKLKLLFILHTFVVGIRKTAMWGTFLVCVFTPPFGWIILLLAYIAFNKGETK